MSALTHEQILRGGRYDALSLDGVAPDLARALHRQMLRLRRSDEAIIREYHPADEMRCPVHFSIGQEAAPGALSQILQKDDYLFSHHRSHGYYLAKGCPLRDFMAELYGRQTGCNGGKAGSMELSFPALNFYSGALLTGALAISIGAALAAQLRKKTSVTVAGFGEAATEEGLFWEAVGYATARKLPVVFVCENNAYSMYSPQLKRQARDDISARVAASGFKTWTVFGNDVIKTHQAILEGVAHARSGQGPAFIEAYTYRWCGHVGPEDDDHIGYRPAAELEFWKKNCPISLLEEKMLERGLLTEASKRERLAEIDAEISDAFAFAKSSPFPTDSDWAPMNLSQSTPVADRLLSETKHGAFNQSQKDAILAPY